MTSNKTYVEFKTEATCKPTLEYLSLVHDVVVLFMFAGVGSGVVFGKLCLLPFLADCNCRP